MSEISKLDQRLIIKKIDSETVNIQITNNEMLMAIVGQFNQNLKELEKLTSTIIFFRGNSITCKGKKRNLRAEISYKGPIEAPITQDAKIAELKVYLKDDLLLTKNVYAKESVKELNIFSKLLKSFNYLIWGDV